MERLFALDFPQTANVALASVRGKPFRYEVNRVGRGKWRLMIDENGCLVARIDFLTKRGARRAAKAHFQRRQCEYDNLL